MIEESQQKSRTSPNRRSGVYKIKSCDTIIAGKETLAYNLQLGGNTKPLSPLFLQLCWTGNNSLRTRFMRLAIRTLGQGVVESSPLSCNGIRKRSQRQLLEAITLSLLLPSPWFSIVPLASYKISLSMPSFYSNLLFFKCCFQLTLKSKQKLVFILIIHLQYQLASLTQFFVCLRFQRVAF